MAHQAAGSMTVRSGNGSSNDPWMPELRELLSDVQEVDWNPVNIFSGLGEPIFRSSTTPNGFASTNGSHCTGQQPAALDTARSLPAYTSAPDFWVPEEHGAALISSRLTMVHALSAPSMADESIQTSLQSSDLKEDEHGPLSTCVSEAAQANGVETVSAEARQGGLPKQLPIPQGLESGALPSQYPWSRDPHTVRPSHPHPGISPERLSLSGVASGESDASAQCPSCHTATQHGSTTSVEVAAPTQARCPVSGTEGDPYQRIGCPFAMLQAVVDAREGMVQSDFSRSFDSHSTSCSDTVDFEPKSPLDRRGSPVASVRPAQKSANGEHRGANGTRNGSPLQAAIDPVQGKRTVPKWSCHEVSSTRRDSLPEQLLPGAQLPEQQNCVSAVDGPSLETKADVCQVTSGLEPQGAVPHLQDIGPAPLQVPLSLQFPRMNTESRGNATVPDSRSNLESSPAHSAPPGTNLGSQSSIAHLGQSQPLDVTEFSDQGGSEGADPTSRNKRSMKLRPPFRGTLLQNTIPELHTVRHDNSRREAHNLESIMRVGSDDDFDGVEGVPSNGPVSTTNPQDRTRAFPDTEPGNHSSGVPGKGRLIKNNSMSSIDSSHSDGFENNSPVPFGRTNSSGSLAISGSPLHAVHGYMQRSEGQNSFRTQDDFDDLDSNSAGHATRTNSRYAASSNYNSTSRGSKTSREKSRRHHRVRRQAGYSAWEAYTHVPNIKSSWGMVMENSTWEDLGVLFYDKMLQNFPDLAASNLTTSDRVTVAKKLADMLYTIVYSVDEPTQLREILRALAPLHLKKGVKKAHMPLMGSILQEMLAEILREEFSPEIKASWTWLWNWISESMVESLLDCKLEASALSESWDIACEHFEGDELGGLLYDALLDLAPNLKATTFQMPRQILAPRFFEMLITLRSFYNDHGRMTEQLTWIGLRHIQYKAKPEHVETYKHCLLVALERAVGEDEWTPAMSKAWGDLWTETCSHLMAVITEAEKYGDSVRQLWQDVRDSSAPEEFGAMLRQNIQVSGAVFANFMEADTWKNRALRAQVLRRYFDSWLEGVKESKSAEQESGRPSIDELAASINSGTFKIEGKEGEIINNDEMLARLTDDSGGKIGTTFWDLLSALIDLLWEPEMQNEKIMVASKELYRWGLRTKDLEVLGLAIQTTIKRILAFRWNEHCSLSWNWFWSMTKAAMGKVLTDCEVDTAKLIRESWQEIQKITTTEVLAETFFSELNMIAPHVVHLFKLPKQMQAIRIGSICEMLIKFFEDPHGFFTAFKLLAIRHISYGVRADMTKPFGQALINAIRKAVRNQLDPKIEEAWADLWTRASSCVTRCLAVASNLIVVALVQGDTKKLSEALDCAPRIERWKWLLQVKVNGETLSPVVWAIRDGRFAMAQFMLQDILAIRADRERYFYGSTALFEEHPDIIRILVRECPELLETLFDGLMWHSKHVHEGRIRVNYYVGDLFGDPDKYPDVWDSPLAVLVQLGEPEIFGHPVVTKVMELKWTYFAKNCFLLKVVWFALLLFGFMLCHIVYGDSCQFAVMRSTLGVVSLATLLVMVSMVVAQSRRKIGKDCSALQSLGSAMRQQLADIWNVARFLSCFCLATSALLEPCWFKDVEETSNLSKTVPRPIQIDGYYCLPLEDVSKSPSPGFLRDVDNAITALTAILLWLQLLQAFSVSTRLAAFSYTIGIMFQDVAHNLVVICVFLFAFASALTALDEQTVFSDLQTSLLVLIRETLGLDHPNLDQTNYLGGALLFIFAILTTVGMLNMLIAQLSLAYENIADRKVGFALKHRAAICVDMESVVSHDLRRKLYQERQFELPVPFGSGDDGPSGGIQEMEPATIRNHPKYVADRILRFNDFEASPTDPWPPHCLSPEEFRS